MNKTIKTPVSKSPWPFPARGHYTEDQSQPKASVKAGTKAGTKALTLADALALDNAKAHKASFKDEILNAPEAPF